jgi:hypothetical protein
MNDTGTVSQRRPYERPQLLRRDRLALVSATVIVSLIDLET